MRIFLNLKENLIEKFFCIQKNSFLITIFIFLIVFILALIIWRDCVLDPKPSQTALENILKAENEYEKQINNIKKNNQKIEELIDKSNNPQNNLEFGRNYFRPDALESDSIDNKTSNKNFNPSLVN